MTEEYYNKVKMLADIKYDLGEEILESYEEQLKQWYTMGFTPRRSVEYLANDLFSKI